MRDPVGLPDHEPTVETCRADPGDVWRHRSNVLSCECADRVFLLSLDTGRYHALEEPAGTIWHLLQAGRTAGEIVDGLSRRFPLVQRHTIDADVRRLIADLRQRNLIEPRTHQEVEHGGPRDEMLRAVRAPRLGAPSTLSCIARLAVVHVLLSTFGLRATLRMIGRRAARAPKASSSAFVDLLAHRVASAGVYYPFGAACLEHSLCLLWVARRCGIDVALRLGVQAFPFSAHAWVEYRERVVNDTPEQIALFTPFQAIRPAGL